LKKILLLSTFISFIFSSYADNKNTLEKQLLPDVVALSMDSIPVRPKLKYKLPSALFISGVAFATVPPFHNIEKSIYTGFNKNPRKQTNVDDYLQYSPAIAVFALDAIGVKGIYKPKEQLLLYAMSNIGATLVVQPMKRIVHRERPDKSDFKSFPSGHTTTAFVAAEFLHQEYGHLSPWISIAGYGTAAATAYLRMQNNVHWFGDVLAGAAIGIASTKISYWLLPKVKKGIKRKNVI
jgi:membrane-associated phospholipid phosphatase